MSRRIELQQQPETRIHGLMGDDPGAPAKQPPGSRPDDYLGRLLKYIPAEVVGLYVAAEGIVPNTRSASLWAIAVVAWILTPLYLYFATRRAGAPTARTQIILATLAFPIWIFAIGGPFKSLAWYEDERYLASILLIFSTAIFGMIQPRE